MRGWVRQAQRLDSRGGRRRCLARSSCQRATQTPRGRETTHREPQLPASDADTLAQSPAQTEAVGQAASSIGAENCDW